MLVLEMPELGTIKFTIFHRILFKTNLSPPKSRLRFQETKFLLLTLLDIQYTTALASRFFFLQKVFIELILKRNAF